MPADVTAWPSAQSWLVPLRGGRGRFEAGAPDRTAGGVHRGSASGISVWPSVMTVRSLGPSTTMSFRLALTAVAEQPAEGRRARCQAQW